MTWIERVHERHVSSRRVAKIGGLLVDKIPRGSRVLEVGAGSGELLAWIAAARPDIEVRGIDVLVRGETAVPVDEFDGTTIPFEAGSFDLVLYVDVLHHTPDPVVALAEGTRVAGRHVLIKDHTVEGFAAESTLRFMDRVGNERFGVALPFNYLTRAQWERAFTELGLTPEVYESRLGLYPWPASLLFDRSLHFLARLAVS